MLHHFLLGINPPAIISDGPGVTVIQIGVELAIGIEDFGLVDIGLQSIEVNIHLLLLVLLPQILSLLPHIINNVLGTILNSHLLVVVHKIIFHSTELLPSLTGLKIH